MTTDNNIKIHKSLIEMVKDMKEANDYQHKLMLEQHPEMEKYIRKHHHESGDEKPKKRRTVNISKRIRINKLLKRKQL